MFRHKVVLSAASALCPRIPCHRLFHLCLTLALGLALVAAFLLLTPRLGPVAAQPLPPAPDPARAGDAFALAVSWGGVISVTASGTFADVAAGDFNHDGRLDLVAVYSTSNGIRAWTGNGSGGWALAVTGLPTTGAYRGVELADVNRDGNLDIVAAGTGVSLWHGDGTGAWSAATGPAFIGPNADGTDGGSAATAPTLLPACADVAVGDWNNDGWPDLAAGLLANGGLTAWSGSSSGTWTVGAMSLPITGTYQHLALCDVNLDGKLDIAAASDAGAKVYTGDGNGRWYGGSSGLPTTGRYTGVACGDVDRDGDNDLLLGGVGLGLGLWSRSAAGTWAAVPSGLPTSGDWQSVALGDINLDGRVDVVASSNTLGLGSWTGSAGGTFATASAGLPNNRKYNALALGDYDDDGRPDILAASNDNKGLQLWRNTTDRPAWYGWTMGSSPNDDINWSDALLLPDGLATVSSSDHCVHLWTGDGLTWVERLPSPCTDQGLVTLASADLNQDGKWDLVAATPDRGLRAWVQGATWTAYQTGLPTTGAYSALALGDVTGDARPEIIAAGAGIGLRVWLNNGSGTWIEASPGLPASSTFADLVLADMNNDGLLDLVTSNQDVLGIRMYTWPNTALPWQETGPLWLGGYSGIAVGDINDDGKPDIAASRPGVQGIELYLGNGAFGVLSTTSIYTSPTVIYARDVALGDVNRDGKLDLASVGVDPALHLARLNLWFGNGGSAWSLASPTSAAVDATRVLLGPLNSDGLLDLLYVSASGEIDLWLAGDLAAPALWLSFAPSGWVSATQSPTCSITVRDTQSGLDVSTAEYSYSTKGGAEWSVWTKAACSGTDATTATQQITAGSVPFGRDSTTGNLIRFRVCDMSGNCGTSPERTVKIDTTPPTPLLAVTSPISPSVWTNDNTIEASWRGSVDNGSGLAGYHATWKQKSTAPTAPPVLNTALTSTVSAALPDASDWYLFVRPVDGAGNWGAAYASLGPFFIDTIPPANIISGTTDPPAGVWDHTSSVDVSWTYGPAGAGSPVLARVGLNHSATSMPADYNLDADVYFPFFDVDEGADWYVHLRAQDTAGNVATQTLHIGPIMLDYTAPLNPTHFTSSSHTPSVWSNDNTVSASWSGATDGSGTSGVAGYGLQWFETTSNYRPTVVDTSALVTTSAPLADGDNWYLFLTTRDNAGNWADDSLRLGPFFIDTTPPIPSMYTGLVTDTGFLLGWTATDRGSGLATVGPFDVQYRVDSGAWMSWLTATSDTIGTWTNIDPLKSYSFRCRARDALGQVSAWSSEAVLPTVEVRVLDQAGKPVAGAEVWAGELLFGRTDSLGKARGHCNEGDSMIARKVVQVFESPKDRHEWDLDYDWAYRVYITSLPVEPDGTIVPPEFPGGTTVFTLTVVPTNTLIGFNVVTSTWWDASADELAVIESNLKQASTYLFDATDGQMFLEHIRIYDNVAAIEEADIRHTLDLNYRAWAILNGINTTTGHVYIERAEDAPTIIHEWGHYALDLNDEYISADDIEGDGKCTAMRGVTWIDLASSIMDYQWNTTEFCSALPGNPHSTDTQQEAVKHMSCWDWIVHTFSDPTGRWKLWMPTDFGIMRMGPFQIPVDAWVSTEVLAADTGACAVTSLTFVDGAGQPYESPVVFVFPDSGSTPMEVGTGDALGQLLVSGVHNKDILEIQDGHGNVVWIGTAGCTPGGPVTITASSPQAGYQSAESEFRVTIGASPVHGASALFLWSRANAPLAAPPVARLWQQGLEPVTVTLGYSPTLGLFIGRVELDPQRPRVGTVAVAARSASGETARMSSQFALYPVDAESKEYLTSIDGKVRLALPAEVVDQDSALGIMATAYLHRPPGLVPLSYPYHLGISPASPELNGTGVLTFYLDERKMSRVVPGSAQMYRWLPETESWVPAGGKFYAERTLVSGRIAWLGTYAVMGRAATEGTPVYLPLIRR